MSMNGSPKLSFHWSPFVWPVCCFDTWYLRQQGPEGPVVFVSRNRERALTGHRTWSRLNGYHALIWGYLFLWYLFLCRSFNIHKTLHKSKAKQKEKSKGNGSKRITEACQIKILTDPHGWNSWTKRVVMTRHNDIFRKFPRSLLFRASARMGKKHWIEDEIST